MLLGCVGGYDVTTLHRRAEVHDTNGPRRTTMANDARGFLGTTHAMALTTLRIRLHITYRLGRVHQVPDTLSRLISPDGNDDKAVDDEVPTYGDHEHALVTTRHRAANTPEPQRMTTNTPMQRADRRERKTKRATNRTNDDDDEERLLSGFERNGTKANVENGDEALDDVLDEDLDIFDLALAYTDDGRDVRMADVPVKRTRNEILEAQWHDDFCQTVLSRQRRKTESAFYEDDYGLLRRRHPTFNDIDQIVLRET